MTVSKSSCRSRRIEVSIAVNSADAVQNVLCSIVKNVAREMRARGCCLAVFTPDGRHLRHVACHGLSEDYVTKGLIAVDRCIAEVMEGKAVTISDAATDDRVQYPEKARGEGIVSILAVPVMLDGEFLGILRVYTDRPRRFTDYDIRFARTAADMGAAALLQAANGDGLHDVDADEFRQQLIEMEWARMPGYCP